MGLNLEQEHRQKEVQKYAYQKTEETSLTSPVELETGRTEFAIGERFSEDSAKLGKKKTWKPSKEQKAENDRIDAALRISKKATAYTLDIHNIMEEREAEKQRIAKEQKDRDPELVKEMKIDLLFSVNFSKRMLSSANIRAHFSEYMTIVETYNELRVSEAERLAPLKTNLEIFTRRMTTFMHHNGLELNGKGLGDERDLFGEYEYTAQDADAFKETTFEDENMESQIDYDGLEELSETIDKEALQKTLDMSRLETLLVKKRELTLGDTFGKPITKWSSVERVKGLATLKGILKGDEESLSINEGVLKGYKEDLNLSEEDKQHMKNLEEGIAKLKKAIIEEKATLLLAEAEAKYMLGQCSDEEVEDAYDDYFAVVQRNDRLQLKKTGISSLKPATAMTKEAAMRTSSDVKNYEFKLRLYEVASSMDDQLMPNLRTALIRYSKASHYSVGPAKEAELLKAVIKARDELIAESKEDMMLLDKILQDDSYKAAMDMINSLRLTTSNFTEVPEWRAIPKTMRVDALEGAGEDLSDLSEEQIAKKDNVPKETEAGKEKGSHRNAALMSTPATTWVNLGKDTPLFSHNPTVNDLRQGKVSNCYMIASTASLIDYDPALIKKCIRDNMDGTVTVRLYRTAKRGDVPPVPVFVRIPKRIPKLINGDDILSSGAVYMQLIERAAAQVGMFREGRDGYQSLWYGMGDEWLAILTGCTKRETIYGDGAFRSKEYDQDKLFDSLTTAKEDKKIFHAGSKSGAGPGMNDDHAYSVLGTKVIDKKRYVILRNPYANMSRVEKADGSVSKSTSYFSSQADETFGIFTIPYEEFLDKMKTISVSDMSQAFRKEKRKEERMVNGVKQMVETNEYLNLQEIADLEDAAKVKTTEELAQEIEDEDVFGELEDQVDQKKQNVDNDKKDDIGEDM